MENKEFREDNPTGWLELKISGSWTVKDFNALLSRAAVSYERLERLRLLCQKVNAEDSEYKLLDEQQRFEERNAVDLTWGTLYRGHRHREVNPSLTPLDTLLDIADPFSASSLSIGGIRLQSPGWVELIGSMNPLKVIGDFLCAIISEKTKRIDIESKASVERERIRVQFVRDVLALLPKSSYGEGAERVFEVIRQVIQPSVTALELIADDSRVKEARVVDDPEDRRKFKLELPD